MVLQGSLQLAGAWGFWRVSAAVVALMIGLRWSHGLSGRGRLGRGQRGLEAVAWLEAIAVEED